MLAEQSVFFDNCTLFQNPKYGVIIIFFHKTHLCWKWSGYVKTWSGFVCLAFTRYISISFPFPFFQVDPDPGFEKK